MATSLVGPQILNLRALPTGAATLLRNRTDSLRRSRRIKSRPHDHREDKFIRPIVVAERVEVAQVDVDLFARLDVGDFLGEDVGPLLREQRRGISLVAGL